MRTFDLLTFYLHNSRSNTDGPWDRICLKSGSFPSENVPGLSLSQSIKNDWLKVTSSIITRCPLWTCDLISACKSNVVIGWWHRAVVWTDRHHLNIVPPHTPRLIPPFLWSIPSASSDSTSCHTHTLRSSAVASGPQCLGWLLVGESQKEVRESGWGLFYQKVRVEADTD